MEYYIFLFSIVLSQSVQKKKQSRSDMVTVGLRGVVSTVEEDKAKWPDLIYFV